MIEEMNAESIRTGKSQRNGHNKFSTWTQEERSSLTKRMALPADENRVYTTLPPSNNTSVDWRGIATPGIKDQGQCGSCWSFGATGALEGAYWRETGNLVSMAEQQLVDCAGVREGYQNMGCQGGTSPWAYDYLKTHYSMHTSDY